MASGPKFEVALKMYAEFIDHKTRMITDEDPLLELLFYSCLQILIINVEGLTMIGGSCRTSVWRPGQTSRWP